MSAAEFLDLSIQIGLGMILLGLAVAFIRLAIGPTLADRVVALDMMNITIIAFCGLYAIAIDDASLLDVAIVVALVGFLATVALARYAERYFERESKPPQTGGSQTDGGGDD
ncbi:monovalent cation/H+ antiporter complex subunit F [Roseinatronobacter sp. NSM]|uniref:monovalent cation/H+ antiporter complex subunit F n=1 Tax=Roseinatronobacter sp. NSM TaxID=3457785 RepID=UPI0040357DCE